MPARGDEFEGEKMEEVRRYDCKEGGCRRAGWWLERDESDGLLVCFRVRHDGASHVQRIPVSELRTVLERERGCTLPLSSSVLS